jgi:hypothetical protein
MERKTYTVYTFRSWEGREGWQCTHTKYVTLQKFLEQKLGVSSGKDIYSAGCDWDVMEKTMEDTARDISTGKVMFIPFGKSISRRDMLFYVKGGFELRFMRAKQFKDWKKDYCEYM